MVTTNFGVFTGPPQVRFLEVDEQARGQRLDNFLIRNLKGVPKTHIYRIIRSGEVRINGARAAAHSRLELGHLVRLPPVRMAAGFDLDSQRSAPAREFPILFEDEHFLAIDKPAGVAVHGGSGVSFGVIEQLRSSRARQPYLELVHRLDRDTSGALLIAKKPSALKNLQQQLRNRTVVKTYLALALGSWPPQIKVIDKSLVRYLIDPGNGQQEQRRVRIARSDDEPGAQRAITLVKVLHQWPSATSLAVTIKTGRTHQIRVHLASEGHPIVGDEKYGHFEGNKTFQKEGLKRMALHAWKIVLTHPTREEPLEILAPLAHDAMERFFATQNQSKR